MTDVSPVPPPEVRGSSTRLVLFGFVAGFFGVLVFHQAVLAALHAAGLTPRGAWAMDPTKPLGVPLVVSAAFWGGLWGIVFALVTRRPAALGPFLLTGLIFGAVLPTLVAWFVVAPLKGSPVAAGWKPQAMMIGPLVNGAFGLGTALLLWIFTRRRRVDGEVV
jgi:hypothetical protein